MTSNTKSSKKPSEMHRSPKYLFTDRKKNTLRKSMKHASLSWFSVFFSSPKANMSIGVRPREGGGRGAAAPQS